MAVADWFHPPEVVEVDLGGWSGGLGEKLRARVRDDAQVKAVHFVIAQADGTLVEEGAGAPVYSLSRRPVVGVGHHGGPPRRRSAGASFDFVQDRGDGADPSASLPGLAATCTCAGAGRASSARPRSQPGSRQGRHVVAAPTPNTCKYTGTLPASTQVLSKPSRRPPRLR